jgi:hypothetical protein
VHRKVFGVLIAIVLIACGRSVATEYDLDDAAKLTIEALKSSDVVELVEQKSADELTVKYSDGTESSFFLGNLLINLNSNPEAEREIIAHYVSVLLKDAIPERPILEDELRRNIVPLVRHTDYMDFLRDAAIKSDEPSDAYFVRALAADYWIILAIDGEDATSVPRHSEFKILGLSDDQLLELAISNLKGRADSELRIQRTNGVNMLIFDGNYESSILLVSDFWRKESTFLGDTIVAIAPARDLLMYCTKSNTECVRRIHEIAIQNFSSLANTISTELIEWSGDNWTAYSP